MALPTDQEIHNKALEEAADFGTPRCRFIEAMLRLPGLSFEDKATRDQYVTELFLTWQDWGPGGPTEADRKWAYQYAPAASLCGVTTQNIWAAAGVDLAYLYRPYSERYGSAVTFERKYAIEHGAWVDAVNWRRGTAFPEAGDAMVIGNNTQEWARGSSTPAQHELNIACWIEGPRGALMGCVDGGQPGIAYRTRGLVEVFPGGGNVGELWASAVAPDGSLPVGYDGRPLNGRRVVGWTNVAKLPFKNAPPCKGGGGWRMIGTALAGLVLGVGGLCLVGACPEPIRKIIS